MPGWLYDALSAFQHFMDRGSWPQVLLAVSVAVGGPVALTAIHELGHALEARARGMPVHLISVGDRARITLRAGGTEIRLGWLSERGDVAGVVRTGIGRASPTDTLLAAAAGPAAGTAASLLCAWISIGLVSDGIIGVMFGLTALVGLLSNLAQLVPDRGADPDRWSDGRWIATSWQARRQGVERWHALAQPASAPPPARFERCVA